jgi:hypothetical protein
MSDQVNQGEVNAAPSLVSPTAAPSAAAPAVNASAAPVSAPAAAAPALAPRRQSLLTAPEPVAETKQEAAPAAEAKPDGEAKTIEGVPEKYEFKVDGFEFIDTALADKAAPILQKLGLNNEQANALAQVYAEHLTQQGELYEANQQKAFFEKLDGWEAETQKQFGDKLPQALESAKIALQYLESPELVELLDTSGLGSHPNVIRSLAKLGGRMRERETALGVSTPQSADAWGFGNR